jgi:hypothetical protein
MAWNSFSNRSPIWRPRAMPDELSLFYRCETIVGRPGIPMALFAVEARVDSFLKVADWLVEELKAG